MAGLRDETPKTHWHTLEDNYGNFLKARGKRHPGGPAFKGIVPEMALGEVTRIKRYSIPKTGCYEEGLDYFYDGYITAASLEAIRGRDLSKPLLLNAMYVAPHPPLDVPEPWYSMYTDARLPDNVAKWSYGQSPLQLYNLTGAIGTRYGRDEWQRIWNVYLGLVTLLDHCVGRLVDELKRQGIYDDTLLIFTSDHGEMLGSHCLYQKMCMYEESVRVPLFVKLPASAGASGGRVDTPVSAVDCRRPRGGARLRQRAVPDRCADPVRASVRRARVPGNRRASASFRRLDGDGVVLPCAKRANRRSDRLFVA